MKKKLHILTFALLAMSMLFFQSCLKDDYELYGDEGNRVENYLINAKNVLTSASNGWHLAYFPHRQLKFGGYNYCLKFTNNNEVTVWYEEAHGQKATSTYAMTSDDGPVLSFDTYNEFMHLFATPSASEYEAKDGDFEFILLKVTDDLITLKGKRSGNIMYMTRLQEEPEAYMQRIIDMKDVDHLYGGGTTTIGGTTYSGVFDMQNRKLTITDAENNEVASSTFIYTPTGIQMAKNITVGGRVLKNFVFDNAAMTFQSSDLIWNMENTWKSYDEFIGSYTVKELSTLNVKISTDVKGSTFKISGLTYQGTVIAEYDSYWGNIVVHPQFLASWSNSTYPSINDWLVVTDGDFVYWGENDKVTTAVSPGEKLTLLFGSNGYTIMEYAFTKPDLEDEDNEVLGLVEDYPQTMIWMKK